MSRRSANTNYSLPANPTYLDFPRSDGTPSTWPTNTTRIVDHEGHVNYHEYLPLDNAQNIRWRALVGGTVARELGMPEGPTYVLRDFPEGYRLFDHNKGEQSQPRHDMYLFGPPKKKFRSVLEFVPHAAWLIGTPGEDCGCKYCTKKTQREVTASLSGVVRSTQSPLPSRVKSVRDKGKGRDSFNKSKEARQRDTRAYAAVQHVTKPLKPSLGVMKQPMLVERNNDLRAIYSITSMSMRRFFREGEVVWCVLDQPIPAPSNPSVAIEFWPAVIEEVKLKTLPLQGNQTDNIVAGPSNKPDTLHVGSTVVDTGPEESGIGPMLEPTNEPLAWTISQSTRYKVQLLAVSHTYIIDDGLVLPYQAHIPSDDLISYLTEYPVEGLDFDKEALSRFNPYVGPIPQPISDAIPAYAAAVQVAAAVSSCWSLTDEYEVKYLVSPSPPPSPKPARLPLPSRASTSSQVLPPSQPPQRTLQEAIEEVSQHNADLHVKVTPHSHYRNIQGTNPNMSRAEVEKASQSALGVPPPPGNLVQTRFQGLWWGSERIWTDDFIRLKIPRRTLAPQGTDNILAPAGPSKSAREAWNGSDRDPAEYGAGSRGVFLRLDGVFAVDVRHDSGSSKEARVCGMLYELVDEDWEDPNEPNEQNGSGGLENRAPTLDHSTSQAGPSNTNNPENGSTSQKNTTIKPVIDSPGQSTYPLPEAPIGYRFRPILQPGYEFIGAMGLISGRYYPRILLHPKIKPIVDETIDNPVQSDNLWALEGLSGGYHNSMDPHRYKKSRVVMMQDADQSAISALQQYAEEKRGEATGDAMEVDHDDIYG